MALDWIETNKTSPDFNEPLLIVGEPKKISPEEARQAAKELQAKLRIKKKEMEEKDNQEKERFRI